MKIFGREPALIIGLVVALLTWGASLGLDWLNAGEATAIGVFIGGVLIAFTTRPWAPGAFVAVVAAASALAAQYGLHWSAAAVTAAGTFVLAAFAFFGIRPQVTPNADPVAIAPAVGNIR